MLTKSVPETVHYISFFSKLFWNHLYLVIILLFIFNDLQKYFLRPEHHISSSVTNLTSGATLSESASLFPWYTYNCSLTYCFSLFLVTATF